MKAIEQFSRVIPFLDTVREVEEDDVFFGPIAPGKWSSAAIVSHLLAWDRFIMEKRLPLMLAAEDLPPSGVDADEMNKQAEQYAHSGLGKRELIDEYIATRKKLLTMLEAADLQKEFAIGGKSMSLEQYFAGLAEHDAHHARQIYEAYKNGGLKIKEF